MSKYLLLRVVAHLVRHLVPPIVVALQLEAKLSTPVLRAPVYLDPVALPCIKPSWLQLE